jgi:hypothetical protein
MSVRIGHMMRHEDVHGVSGTGKVADVFEATNGKCIIVWRSAHSSVNVYDNIKHLESTHSHGGKSLVIWDWESAPDPDPMDTPKEDEGEKPALTEEEAEEIAQRAAEEGQRLVAAKLAQKLSEPGEIDGVPEKESEKPRAETPKKKAAAKKSAASKKAAGKK